MSKPTLDATVLAQFTGSERFFRPRLVRGVLYTEGVRYVAEIAGALSRPSGHVLMVSTLAA